MSKPTVQSWAQLKRLGRYLKKHPRVTQVMQWGDSEDKCILGAWSDSDWAGCRTTRRSTSGACFLHGSYLLKVYSRTQATVALVSAEADLYATVTAASEGLGLAAMCEEYGNKVDPWVHVDASAGIGVSTEEGTGASSAPQYPNSVDPRRC